MACRIIRDIPGSSDFITPAMDWQTSQVIGGRRLRDRRDTLSRLGNIVTFGVAPPSLFSRCGCFSRYLLQFCFFLVLTDIIKVMLSLPGKYGDAIILQIISLKNKPFRHLAFIPRKFLVK